MAFTNAEKQARFRAKRAKELEALRKIAAEVEKSKAKAKKSREATATKGRASK